MGTKTTGKSRPRKKKILMMADANFLAHVSRLLEIAKELRDRGGYDVTIAGDGKFLQLAKDERFKTDAVYTVARYRTMELARRAGLVNYKWWKDEIHKSIESDIACIRRNQPDLVAGDMHWSLGASCRMTDVPYVSITNAHWTKYYGLPYDSLETHFATDLVGPRLGGWLMNSLKKYLLFYWVIPYRRFGQEHGLPFANSKTLFDIIEGDITLLADIPEYGVTTDLPDHIQYVGPIIWEPKMKNPSWLKKLDPERPTFYFTMGSTGSSRFFEEAVKIFGESRYQIVITTGGLPLNIHHIPKNCYIEQFAPGRPIMERSNVAVNHGGNGTVYQALASGTPIVGIPFHIDQEINLQRVESLGFGIKLSERNLSTEKFIDAIESVLYNRKYKENALRLQKVANSYGGASKAADIIHQYLH